MEINKQIIKISGNILLLLRLYYFFRFYIPRCILREQWDEYEIKRKFKAVFGYEIDLDNPKTLNEKIQWLKLNDRKTFYSTCADKLAVRKYWKQFGEDSLIPLLFKTTNWREITYDNLPTVPCIVKSNTGCGYYEIIRDRNKVNIRELQKKCRKWMIGNYYYSSQEWQYKSIKPCIIIEKLLLNRDGHIPNDFKLHFINGELQFIYCSIDREGENYRSIYSPEWKRLNIEWVSKDSHRGLVGKDIDCPKTFHQMVKIGEIIAKNFKYVRVDFYDVDGKLYYGEITLHHGSGLDTFEPKSYDLFFGNKLKL